MDTYTYKFTQGTPKNSSFHSAYQSGHSTEIAHLKVVNDLLLAMDEGKLSILVLLQRLITIDHDILLHCL